jgi:hypothetical protein
MTTNQDNKLQYKIIMVLFFLVSTLEVIAEFVNNTCAIYILKPLILPFLMLLYWKTSSKKGVIFIIALVFGLIANIFYVSKTFNSIMTASIFYMMYRFIVIYLVLKVVHVKNYLPVFLGSIPFMIVFLYLTSLVSDDLGDTLYIYLAQIISMSFLGGFSVANYMVDDKRMNYWLLMSCILFTIIQFVLILKIYYITIYIFQPLAMILFVFAQYSLYKFVIMSEELDDDTSAA